MYKEDIKELLRLHPRAIDPIPLVNNSSSESVPIKLIECPAVKKEEALISAKDGGEEMLHNEKDIKSINEYKNNSPNSK